MYDFHLQGVLFLATSFISEMITQDQDFFIRIILRSQKERNRMNKLRILLTDFIELKLINFSAHRNEKVQFGWLCLTLNMTSPLFSIIEKSLQTVLGERKLREKSWTKRNLSRLQPERQKIFLVSSIGLCLLCRYCSSQIVKERWTEAFTR